MEGEIFYPQRKIILIKTYYFEIKVTPSKNVYFFYQDGNVKMVCLLIVASE
jgi:hypothetical protein